MTRRAPFRRSFLTACVLWVTALPLFLVGAESPAQQLAARPYYSIFAASIDRLLSACETVFDSVDRPDLSASLNDRLKWCRDFSGIDRTKPLGIMSTWESDAQSEIVFVPINDIDELLKTATFGIPYKEVSPNRYQIDKPGPPYHVLVRNGYAFFADSPSTIQALRVTPEQLTREFRDRYEFVVHFDLKQIPKAAKIGFADGLRARVEPWLQEQDHEASETGNLRKALGRLALDLIQRVTLDTNTATFGAHLDPKTRLISLELIVEAAKGSQLEAGLSRLVSRRSELTSLISPDVPAGLALNLPLGGIIDQTLGQPSNKGGGSKLDAGLQIAGARLGELSLIAALRGPEAGDLNRAIPHLIIKFEKMGSFTAVCENFDFHKGIVFHSLVPRDVPAELAQFIGPDVEILIGQGKQTLWIGVGSPERLLEQMKQAIDVVDEAPPSRGSGPLVRGRFQAKLLPELVTSDLVIPGVDPETSARAAFAEGGDGFSVTIEPVSSGLKIRIEAEEGFVRLIGREWVRQIDDAVRSQ